MAERKRKRYLLFIVVNIIWRGVIFESTLHVVEREQLLFVSRDIEGSIEMSGGTSNVLYSQYSIWFIYIFSIMWRNDRFATVGMRHSDIQSCKSHRSGWYSHVARQIAV